MSIIGFTNTLSAGWVYKYSKYSKYSSRSSMGSSSFSLSEPVCVWIWWWFPIEQSELLFNFWVGIWSCPSDLMALAGFYYKINSNLFLVYSMRVSSYSNRIASFSCWLRWLRIFILWNFIISSSSSRLLISVFPSDCTRSCSPSDGLPACYFWRPSYLRNLPPSASTFWTYTVEASIMFIPHT